MAEAVNWLWQGKRFWLVVRRVPESESMLFDEIVASRRWRWSAARELRKRRRRGEQDLYLVRVQVRTSRAEDRKRLLFHSFAAAKAAIRR